ncbi:MAG TPA: GNAT family N-acyltransferase [Tenuifilaceae bacterium]|nr:GNAT family N-acyltransferase [Tenuifilaceae bacterium]HPE19096.1 GNAT family N-acyltransferase [Tenuifilaceae bacterium]HPJ46605.1 GNAT family N-acyltransferase [Tenuifilaceae bacterium]HPQ34959.1 GNAT family N-acyltransferase [Tenuifilaceae bacterium]HRX68763.1 GNAT family N-acyltransferase [Tenuifilaceae bacterium]
MKKNSDRKLVESEEFKKVAGLNAFGGIGVANLLMSILKINKVNNVYSQLSSLRGQEFLDALLKKLEIKYEVNPDEVKRIPKEGPFIIISNHPYGGIDGLILVKIVQEIRNDYKMMANFLLRRIEPIKDYVIPVDPFEGKSQVSGSVTGIKNALLHIKEGKSMGIFPAGEVSTYYNTESPGVADKQWSESILKFIKKAQVPVIPVYFSGTNSKLFHILGLIHPMLRTIKLPSELFNKKNKIVKLRIGIPITVSEQNEFTDISRYGRFLRLKTYALGSSIEVRKFFNYRLKSATKPEPLIQPVAQELIQSEVESLLQNYLLFKSKNYCVICAPSVEMPNIMTEIGRLREVTFREVGEGTNRKIDIDEFDLYYNQLFIWDEDEKAIVGAYRAGKGKEILDRYGIKGFYIQSLFKIDHGFLPILNQSIELGRSFIVKEYQKKPMPLFLLWKGILYFLIKNPEYRYLIGPVSISSRFSNYSKGVIVNFMKANYYDSEFARFITPRNQLKVPVSKDDTDVIFEKSNDINKLDKFIQDIEPDDFRMPVLLKKYIKLNGKIIGFNVDPKFNNALDGLLILDLFQVPIDTITSLSKEINDKSLLDRFNVSDFTFQKEE